MKKLCKRSIAILLSITLITSMLTFCLSRCQYLKEKTYADTKLEISSQLLKEQYQAFQYSLASNNREQIKKEANKLKDIVNQSVIEFEEYTKEVNYKITDSDDIIKKRSQSFESDFQKNAGTAINTLNDIILYSEDTKNNSYLKSLDTLKKCFETENTVIVTEDVSENSEGAHVKKQIESVDINNLSIKEDTASTSSTLSVDTSLKIEEETTLSEDLQSLTKELQTPLKIYSYLKNHIDYEFYSGSRKGAVATFDSKGGNDVDQASLLIAMLRYMNYPARYVRGTIFITAEQALNLTLATDLTTAGMILSSSGNRITAITSGGKIIGFQMVHTWVETYLPYSDYRGANKASGTSAWIPLDTGIKSYYQVETVFSDMEQYYATLPNENDVITFKHLTELSDKFMSFEKTHRGEEVYVRARQIDDEELTYLPLSLQYAVWNIEKEYDTIAESDSDSISFLIDGREIAKLRSYQLYGKRLTLEYMPATESDNDTVRKFDSIFNTPSYLIHMVATLKLDNAIIGKGREVILGSNQSFSMKVFSEGRITNITNTLIVGSIYQITQDMQFISQKELTKSFDELNNMIDSVSLENIYSSEYIGKFLDVAGKLYFSYVDSANIILAETNHISLTRSLSVGITGYAVRSQSMWGIPVGIAEGSLCTDIDLNSFSAVNLEGKEEKEFGFMTAAGITSSIYEGMIWSIFTGISGTSTVSVLREARRQGQNILLLTAKDFQKQQSKLHLDSQTYYDVKSAVDTGKTVMIHTDSVKRGIWSGYGYIITSPETGESAYMISGGLNGGLSYELVGLAFMLNIFLNLLNMEALFSALLTVAGLAGTMFLIPEMIAMVLLTSFFLAWADIINSVILLFLYALGDGEAGQELVRDTIMNLILSVATPVAMAGAKSAAAKATKITLKEFNECFGPEFDNFVETLIENTVTIDEYVDKADEPAEIPVHIIELDAAGVPTETVFEILENSSEYSLDTAAKYGEEAASVIAEYGDSSALMIEKYGIDAAKVITDYSYDGMKALINGIKPDYIFTLAESKNITPSEFDKMGIIDEKTAQEMIERK